jgi:DNA-binding PadR family transcriptional regulator
MHFRHNHDRHPDHERFGRGPFGGFGGRHGPRHGGGFGGRESRVFDSGELKLVILAMIAEKPRHGYELMKDLGERVGGEYTPSPGVIYPTLTLLEEMGYATQTTDANNRKLYALTSEGETFLADNKPQVDAIFARLDERGEASGRPGMGSLFRAMMNLRASVRLRARSATPEQLQHIVDAIDAAAKTIERL